MLDARTLFKSKCIGNNIGHRIKWFSIGNNKSMMSLFTAALNNSVVVLGNHVFKLFNHDIIRLRVFLP